MMQPYDLLLISLFGMTKPDCILCSVMTFRISLYNSVLNATQELSPPSAPQSMLFLFIAEPQIKSWYCVETNDEPNQCIYRAHPCNRENIPDGASGNMIRLVLPSRCVGFIAGCAHALSWQGPACTACQPEERHWLARGLGSARRSGYRVSIGRRRLRCKLISNMS